MHLIFFYSTCLKPCSGSSSSAWLESNGEKQILARNDRKNASNKLQHMRPNKNCYCLLMIRELEERSRIMKAMGVEDLAVRVVCVCVRVCVCACVCTRVCACVRAQVGVTKLRARTCEM